MLGDPVFVAPDEQQWTPDLIQLEGGAQLAHDRLGVGDAGQCAGVAGFGPLDDVGGVEAFAAQDRAFFAVGAFSYSVTMASLYSGVKLRRVGLGAGSSVGCWSGVDGMVTRISDPALCSESRSPRVSHTSLTKRVSHSEASTCGTGREPDRP
jgi:hypothetical protein